MSDNDDIAKLLRALNDDIRPDAKAPAGDGYADDADDEGEEDPPRQMPYGKIALALLTAAGIGLAVVVLDGSRSAAPPAPAPGALVPSQNAETLQAPPATGATGMTGMGMAPSAQPPAYAQAPVYPQNPGYAQTPGYAPPQGLAAPRSGAAPEGLIARPGAGGGATPPVAQQLQTQTVPIPSVAPPTSGMPVAPPPAAAAVAPPPASPPSEAPRNAVAAIPPADTAALQAALAPKTAQPPQRPPVLVKPTSRTQPEEPATPARSIPDGRYAVQVGTFRDAANADSLLHKLNSHGFRAYTVDWTDQNAQSWRAVRVGGTDSQNEAKHLASELKSKLGINGYIVSAK